jgi:hypothetical protein
MKFNELNSAEHYPNNPKFKALGERLEELRNKPDKGSNSFAN